MTEAWVCCPRCRKNPREISAVDGYMQMYCASCADEIPIDAPNASDVHKSVSKEGRWKKGQWPGRICSGFIRYDRGEYGGFVFRDASHGIPVLGHVKATTTGSYPDQAEMIARRLVACWNACQGMTIEDIEAKASANIITKD